MNQEREDEVTSPTACLCFVIPKHELCPMHGLDRSQTTEHPSRVKPRERVVNTTESLKRG